MTLPIWLSLDADSIWLTRVPLLTPAGESERVAEFLAPQLFQIAGPYPAFRQSTVDEAKRFVDETARLFVALAEAYLEILDSDGNPAERSEWESRKIIAVETIDLDTSVQGDTQPPDLRSFDISPGVLYVARQPAAVICRARIVDDVAGVAGEGYRSSPSQARFRSPSGQIQDVLFHHLTRVEGDALDGVYEDRLALQPQAERGSWKVEYVLVVDQVGNQRHYQPSELELHGFPTRFELR